jgi:prepilin-type N-terminal cleavage/methylation domain-containing protein
MQRSFKFLLPSLSRQCQGFTLLELVLTTLIAGVILAASLGVINEQRRNFLGDRDRININDNLRVALSLIGDDVKQAGERLEQQSNFPVVNIIDGVSGTSDRIILQRQKLAEVLTICQNLSIGSTSIEVADAKDNPNCATGSSPNITKWQEERWRQDNIAGSNGSPNERLWAYILDPNKPLGSPRGEFIQITGETKGSCSPPNNSNAECWTFTLNQPLTLSYSQSTTSATQPKLYVLEQREYRLSDDTQTTDRTDDKVLELIVNNQDSNPQRITNLLDDMQIRARTVSATGVETWDAEYNPNPNAAVAKNWQTLGGIEITLRGLNPSTSSGGGLSPGYTGSEKGLSLEQLTLQSQFLPRNVTSKTQ